MAKPEHHARWEGRTKPRRRRLHRQKAPQAQRWRSRNTRGFDVKVDGSDSAEMYPKVRPRLRSQIGEVRGSLLHRISFAEYMAREAAVRDGARVEPSSLPSSKPAATHDTNPVSSCFTRDTAAVQGSSPKAPPYGTKRLLSAATEPRPQASATPPDSKKMRKTVVPSTQPPMITPADLILKTLRDVPERRNAEPEVLVRASYLKSRFAGLIAKAEETLSIRHRQNLEKQPAADIDQGSSAAEAECEMALLQEEEWSAQVDALRKKSREALQEVEKNGRHKGLSRETIHPVHLMELGITAVEHIMSPERSHDRAPPTAPKNCRRHSPLEEFRLFVKPVDHCGEEEMETT